MKPSYADCLEIRCAISHQNCFLVTNWLMQTLASLSLGRFMAYCHCGYSSRVNVPCNGLRKASEKKHFPQTWATAKQILGFLAFWKEAHAD